MLVIAGDRELPRVAVVGSRVRALPRPRFGNIPVHNPRHAAVHAVVTEELEVEPMALSNAVVPQPEWRLSQQNENQPRNVSERSSDFVRILESALCYHPWLFERPVDTTDWPFVAVQGLRGRMKQRGGR